MEWLLTLDGAVFCNWNSYVKSFMSSKPVQKLVEQKMFSVKNSFRHLKQVLFEACVTMIEAGDSQLKLEYLETAADCDGLENNGLTDMIRDLSVTEICLLIAIKHLEQIYDNEPFNFEMVYHEFVKFKRRKYSTLTDDRSVITKCWENLLELELVSAKTQGRGQGGGGGVQDQYSLHVGLARSQPRSWSRPWRNTRTVPRRCSSGFTAVIIQQVIRTTCEILLMEIVVHLHSDRIDH